MTKAKRYAMDDTLTAAIALDGAEAARERFSTYMLVTAHDIAGFMGPLLAKGKGRPGKSEPEVKRAQWVDQYAAGTGCKRPSAVTAVNRLITVAVIVDKHAGRVKGGHGAQSEWVLKVRQAVKAGTADDAAALAAKYVADPVAFVAGRARSAQSAQNGANVGPNGNGNQNPNVTTSTTPDAPTTPTTPDAGKGGKGGKGGTSTTPDAGQGTPDAGQGGTREVEPVATVPGYRELAAMAARIVRDRRNGSSKANPFELSPEEYNAFQAIELLLANARREHDRTMAAKAAKTRKGGKGGKAA